VIDLRPGAVETASFGPALPSVAPRASIAPAPLASKPTALAQPYAGAPYQVAGKWYVPAYEPNYDEVGIASWYGPTFHGKASASGETFDQMAMTAAHPTLPIPSIVRVTNLENGKSALVRLNDRGPFVDDRIIDLSKHAGEVLGLHAKGTAKVRVQYVGPAPANADAPLTDVQPAAAARPALASQPVQAEPVVFQAAPQSTPLTQASMPSVELSPATLPSPTLDTRPGAPLKLAAGVSQPARPAAGFYLQAGAFADPANAEGLRAKLSTYGQVDIVKSEGARTLSRVMVGPFASKADAEAVQARMTEAGAKTLLVSKGN
jgi:rare lipoprotein A